MTIVWDVDDVLNDLTRSWFELVWRPEHPASELTFDRLTANPPNDVLGMPLQAYLDSLDTFRRGASYASMTPNVAVAEWLSHNAGRCRNIALTATPISTAPTTAAWVLRSFGRWIREFAFVPSARPSDPESAAGFDRTKAAWLAARAPRAVFIDDSPANLAAAEEVGCSTIAWPQPWNRGAQRGAPLEQLGRLV